MEKSSTSRLLSVHTGTIHHSPRRLFMIGLSLPLGGGRSDAGTESRIQTSPKIQDKGENCFLQWNNHIVTKEICINNMLNSASKIADQLILYS